MRIALALGSGGARGYAHIGVLAELESRGHEVVSIAGSSMGAVVGGLRAAERLDEYTEWVLGLSQRAVLRLLDPAIKAPGVIRAEKVMSRVRTMLRGANIEDLPIPFTAVATDLVARREVWFQRGPVDVAIRASIALPTVITPVTVNGRLLADGGLLNPIPVAPLVSAPADAIVAVSLSGPGRKHARAVPVRESVEETPEGGRSERSERLARLARRVHRRGGAASGTGTTGSGGAPGAADDEAEPAGDDPLDGVARHGLPAADPGRDTPAGGRTAPSAGTAPDAGEAHDPDGDGSDPPPVVCGPPPPGLRTRDIVDLSLGAMQSMLTRYRLAGYAPDVVVTIPADACGTLDFHRAAEMIELGRAAARAVLDGPGGAALADG